MGCVIEVCGKSGPDRLTPLWNYEWGPQEPGLGSEAENERKPPRAEFVVMDEQYEYDSC